MLVSVSQVVADPAPPGWRRGPTPWYKYPPILPGLDDGVPRWFTISGWALAPLLYWTAIGLAQLTGKRVTMWRYNVPDKRFRAVVFEKPRQLML